MKGRPEETTMRKPICLLLATLLAFTVVGLPAVLSAPAGAQITFNSTDNGPTKSPGSLTTNRSTITTVVLSAIQQDAHWKAYVGNVTGSLTLQDVNNNTIYNWNSITTPTGKVIASRNGSLNFGTVACANSTVIGGEQTLMNMSGTDQDNIMQTFNSTAHTPTTLAAQPLSGCNMTSTYVNNVSQGQNGSATFQEFLMQDTNANLAYVSLINASKTGYNGRTYDFQMIVAESQIQAPHTYYFYIELGN
jgi:hypothetical protein